MTSGAGFRPLARFRAITACALAGWVLAAGATDAAPTRPRVGLVLGGGGARGAAHIGVLEVLEEMRVRVDCVAGTSMGGLVAGAFAGGLKPAQMSAELAKADWRDMFRDNPEYSETAYRNKALARRFLPGSETGVTEQGLQYRGGVLAGEKIKLFFNKLVRSDLGERAIESLPLPLSIIASDIGSGERVVFREGSLTTAMRASMSVPALLAPVDHRGRKLVDGGLVDNVPIAEVRERCGADVVIAVNVASPLLKPEDVGSLLSVTLQMINILTEQNVTRSLATLKPADIYIKPELDGISASDFAKHAEAAARGRKAAEAVRDRLASLSVVEADYRAWWNAIAFAPRDAPRVDEIEVAGLTVVNPAAVTRHLRLEPGDRVDAAELDHDLLRVYGDGYYQSVDYELLSARDKNILRILPVEKPWGPDYLRFGLNLQTTVDHGSTYTLRGAYHRTWLNSLGAEALAFAEIGNHTRLGLEFYQPLEASQRFYVEPVLSWDRRQADIWQNDERVAQYTISETNLALMAGMNVGILGQVRLGWEGRDFRSDREIGSPLLPGVDKRYGGWRAALDFDQTDRLYVPTKGWSTRLIYFDSPQEGYSRVDANLRAAHSFGDIIVNGRLRYTGSPRGQLPFYDAGRLGGFLNLSGFVDGQLVGDEVQYASLRIEKIIGRLPLGLRGDMRVGFALEGARVNGRYTETERGGLLDSAALYVGGETPLGVVFLGYGYSTSGVSNLYLFVGTP